MYTIITETTLRPSHSSSRAQTKVGHAALGILVTLLSLSACATNAAQGSPMVDFDVIELFQLSREHRLAVVSTSGAEYSVYYAHLLAQKLAAAGYMLIDDAQIQLKFPSYPTRIFQKFYNDAHLPQGEINKLRHIAEQISADYVIAIDESHQFSGNASSVLISNYVYSSMYLYQTAQDKVVARSYRGERFFDVGMIYAKREVNEGALTARLQIFAEDLYSQLDTQ